LSAAAQIDKWVARRAPISLTQLFDRQRPIRLDALGYDEIAFVYADQSRYVTALTSDDEYIEFMSLRERIIP
jgi:hypothetical protein